jgi:hypothetical protein
MRIPKPAAELIRAYAKKHGMSATEAVAELIDAGAKTMRRRKR